ncbi:MAG: hypothetical protein A2020_00920 [Lentisphaerae bacterium GWF2_45_14]|nr:MAG: hypothetical protein A2020_00920 [Lentisphaerae bacterium GWF2_45_14]
MSESSTDSIVERGVLSVDTEKKAKQILKGESFLCCRVEEKIDTLRALFRDHNGGIREVIVRNFPDGELGSECPICSSEELLCPHGAAAAAHYKEFRDAPVERVVTVEVAPKYSGIKYETLPEVLAKVLMPQQASLSVHVESDFPHVPSKWEKTVITVKINAGSKEYIGNLANLRQLHFKKVMSVSLKITCFSPQERQIIRYLAINSEADGPKLSLDAEQTAEFFHCLTDFERFFKSGEKIIVHEDTAEPVLLCENSGSTYTLQPTVVIKGAVVPVKTEKVITGRSGCWLGIGGEYWWIPGKMDVAWIRSFFRASGEECDRKTAEFMLSGQSPMPIKIFEIANGKPKTRRCVPLYFAEFTEDHKFTINLTFMYDGIPFPPDGARFGILENILWKRDSKYEKFISSELYRFGFKHENRFDRHLTLCDIESIGTFLDKIVPEWTSKGRKFLFSETISKLSNGGNGLLEMGISCRVIAEGHGMFELEYSFGHGNSRFFWKELLHGIKLNRSYFLGSTGAILKLGKELARFVEYASNIIHIHKEHESIIQVPRFAAHYWVDSAAGIPGAVPPEFIAVKNMMQNSGKLPDIGGSHSEKPLEQKFKGSLRNYQKEGVAWMRNLAEHGFNPVLADEMGLGKTIQALAMLSINEESRPSLILCPSSLVENWEREAEKFVPSLKSMAVSGQGREKLWEKANDKNLIITSYALAKRDVELMKDISFNYLILDEAQHIKNPFTENAKICKNIKSRHRLVLTGTPLENSPEDLWSIFDFLHPGLLGNYHNFKAHYGDIHEDKGRQEDLAARVSPFILRRKKKAVCSELPPKMEQVLYCDMDNGQKALYDRFLEQSRQQFRKISETHEKSVSFDILASLLRLRQICCHPQLLPSELEPGEASSAKTDLLQEIVLQNIDSGHKMLIFSQFTSLLSIIRSWLDTESIKYEYLDGSTKDRMDRVDNFNNSKDIPIFLLSLKAGGTGLNLTSADTVIIYDPWWNPAVEAQATDRTHRIGQTLPVNSFKLVVKDSIEERILHLQKKKQDIFDSLIENPEYAAKRLDLHDIEYLLQ